MKNILIFKDEPNILQLAVVTANHTEIYYAMQQAITNVLGSLKEKTVVFTAILQ